MQVRDFLHAEPAELAAADGARHVVAAAVVHFNDVRGAARTRLDVVGWKTQTQQHPGRSLATVRFTDSK